MKTILKMKLLLVLTLLSLLSLAQEQRYIEIIATDTLTLKPKLFTYQIKIGEQTKIFGIAIPESNKDSISLSSLSEIETMLKKEHFAYALNIENDYSIGKNSQNSPSILLTLNSTKDLDKLYNLIKPVDGISGKIINIEFEAPTLYYDEIFKRLYLKAQTEASALAHATGNEIGKLLNISEIKDQWDGYSDWLKQISNNISFNLFGQNNDLTKKYERKIQFKFELK